MGHHALKVGECGYTRSLDDFVSVSPAACSPFKAGQYAWYQSPSGSMTTATRSLSRPLIS